MLGFLDESVLVVLKEKHNNFVVLLKKILFILIFHDMFILDLTGRKKLNITNHIYSYFYHIYAH